MNSPSFVTRPICNILWNFMYHSNTNDVIRYGGGWEGVTFPTWSTGANVFQSRRTTSTAKRRVWYSESGKNCNNLMSVCSISFNKSLRAVNGGHFEHVIDKPCCKPVTECIH